MRFLFFFIGRNLCSLIGSVIAGVCNMAAGRTAAPAAVTTRSCWGQIVRVVDGDTVHCVVNGERLILRLMDMDAPEHDQPFGAEATRYLASLVAGKFAGLQLGGQDVYGRTLAHLFVDNQWINGLMVQAGCAWADTRGPYAVTLGAYQQDAVLAGRGLWHDVTAIRPSEWRSTYSQPHTQATA